jgi:tetratricopeptide (TPR) repeat protein
LIKYFNAALAIAHEFGHRQYERELSNYLGIANFRLRRNDEAMSYFSQALSIATEFGDSLGEGVRFFNIGLVHSRLKDVVKAKEYITQAISLVDPVDSASAASFRRRLKMIK